MWQVPIHGSIFNVSSHLGNNEHTKCRNMDGRIRNGHFIRVQDSLIIISRCLDPDVEEPGTRTKRRKSHVMTDEMTGEVIGFRAPVVATLKTV